MKLSDVRNVAADVLCQCYSSARRDGGSVEEGKIRVRKTPDCRTERYVAALLLHVKAIQHSRLSLSLSNPTQPQPTADTHTTHTDTHRRPVPPHFGPNPALPIPARAHTHSLNINKTNHPTQPNPASRNPIQSNPSQPGQVVRKQNEEIIQRRRSRLEREK